MIENRFVWKPWVGQRGHNDDEPFKPHTDDNGDRSDQRAEGGPGSLETEKGQWDDKTEEEHPPEIRGKPAGELGPKDRHMEGVCPVEGRKVFCERKVKPEEGHDQQEDPEVIEMDRP